MPARNVDWLVQIRIGLVLAFDQVTDQRIEWSLLAAIEDIDRQIDYLVDTVHPSTDLGQYLQMRDWHHPVAIPDDLSDLN